MSKEGPLNAIASQDNPEAAPETRTLGLVAAPDMPEAIATRLAAELPALLKEHVDDRICWKVPVVSDPFIGSGDDEPKVLDIARDHMLDQQWDVAVSLTDVPVY
ncbi:MAG TPA: hypothetical protein VFK96_01005, partial [Gammaproteobacteria bacterium]|nr:hypothetical protein [Gammaproteobacteria bacterium]